MKSFRLFFAITPIFLSCTPRPSPAPIVNKQVVLAEVDNSTITDNQLMTRIKDVEENLPRTYSTHPQKLEFLTQMMNLELLYQEAIRIGLDNDFAFKARLAETYINRLAQEARKSITQKDIEKYYQTYRDNIDQVSARHILLKIKDKKSKEERAAVLKKIEGLRKDLIQDPTRFSEFAQKYSEDGTAATGGDLGLFNRAMMVKSFSDAAFKLKNIGDISPVIESEFGFHIIQLSNDRRGVKHYEEAIKDRIVNEAQKNILNRELIRLKKDKKFHIYEDALAKLSPLPKEILTDPAELIPKNGIPEENKKP